jgi:outer membrane protein assembly factor BamE (lipoprotein component of BamABCDE complex)
LDFEVFFFGTAISYTPQQQINKKTLLISPVIYYISSIKSRTIIFLLVIIMGKSRFIMNKMAVLLLALLLSSCQSLNTRGVFIEDSKIKQITSQETSKEQLLLTLGVPTLKPDYSPDTWYYISRTLENKPWATPKVVKQRVVQVTFKGDIVDKLEVIDNKHKTNITIVTARTKVHGTEENPVQSFVKNFGRFNKTPKPKRH